MTRIDRYMLSQFLTQFGFFALVLVSVYWINRAVRLFEQLIQDGQTALVVLEFTALTLPVVIALVLPVAAFAATAYGTNRLASESEMTVMQAAGLSPWRLARPALVFGLLVGLMVAILAHGLVPMARARLAERQADIAENVSARFLRAGSFQHPGDGVTLFIGEIAPDGRLIDLFLEDARNPGSQTIYTAEEALVLRGETGPRLVMARGMVQTLRSAPGAEPRLSTTRFADLTYDIGALFSVTARRGRDLRDYSTPRLLNPDPELLAATGASAERARTEGHERLAQPLLAPVGALLGFSMLLLGGFSRFGVWRQVIWAVVALLFVHFLSTAAASRAAKTPESWPLLYVPAIAGAAMVMAALWVAARPRRLRGADQAEVAP
ncbi:LPS export ABC transporter permease LptF [Paracoccus sp. (in: a-proteobacteria)]|uniref:LPS export ABC transporter permease LptF n=1 Tax=Paracoccus sp. TaxID=267 RepID=UPI0026E0ECB6|nr:LPS export ABC transporter permease LptF [Paracoccus sp. (in: a-proteobacteria)]MDO5370768.1 LPS export ABC transporter permease LptF [Paracoccus sp. (in: a-proteobacteria)]